MKQPVILQSDHCPCGSQKSFGDCCGRYLSRSSVPETAEQLMRSRYCAFLLEDSDYLLHTWHHDERPTVLNFESDIKWLGLKVKETKAGTKHDSEGWVHFIARYRQQGKGSRIDEYSYFTKQQVNGQLMWQYVRAD
jgi:SEC-C motif-containing protein